MEIVKSLNHKQYSGEECEELFELIHSAQWGTNVEICRNFNLKKIKGDMTIDSVTGSFDLIYFDAFGPDKQPEMWSVKIFSEIADRTNKNGILVTYSAKGAVKRNLTSCGFEVELLPGPPGKRQIIRAIKK